MSVDRPISPIETIDHATHDLFDRHVDGWYWRLLEETFADCEREYRDSGDERAAAIAHRLIETTDEVPAEIMREVQDLLCDAADHPDGLAPSDLAWDEMVTAFGADYSPNSATAFALDFIQRMTARRMI